MKIELQNGYQAFPFQAGKKRRYDSRILEGLNLMSYGDKVVLFIPSNLAYGEQLVALYHKRNPDFEMEMLENQQVQNNKNPSKATFNKKPDIFLYRVSL
jgi:hypothetical protein